MDHKFASALFTGEAHLKRQLEAHRSAKSVFHCRPPNTQKVFPIRNSPGQQTMKRRLPPLKRVYSPESKPIFGLWLKLIPARRFQCRDFAVDASNAESPGCHHGNMLILLAGSLDDTNDCAFSDTCVSLCNLGNKTLQSLCHLAYASIVCQLPSVQGHRASAYHDQSWK